jgi:histidinol-phosphate aminotransferase
MPVRHKEWVDSVVRFQNDEKTRHGLLRLDKNERISSFSTELWEKAIGRLNQEHVQAYPEVDPLYSLLTKFNNRDRSEIILTPGSDAAIRNAFDLCVKPGDGVVFLKPTFAMVEVYCDLYNAKKCIIEYDQDLTLNVELILDSLHEGVSLIVIANPNSPTGTIMLESDLEKIVSKGNDLGILVLIDEAYFEFSGRSSVDFIDEYHNVMITRTFSKAFGLAGLRIGYVMAHPSLVSLLSRFRPMYEVNSIALIFSEVCLENQSEIRSYLEEVEEGRNYLKMELEKMNIRYVDTHTNFIHIDFREKKSMASNVFEQNGIIIRDGLKMDSFRDSWRITLGPKPEMEKLVGAIRSI